MTSRLNPYVGFAGNARQALEFYRDVWGDEFGMCVDQFGIPWMVNISQPEA